MTYDYQIGDGAHALDQQQWLDWHRGYQVVNAAGGSNLLTAGSADFDVDAASGDINFGGTTVSCAAETINLSGVVDPDNPRKVTVYRDGSGTLQYEAGVAEPAQDTGETRRDAYRPAPPPLETTDAVVLGTVWVSAGATSIVSNDIRDRRLPAEANVETVTADTGSVDSISGTDLQYESVTTDESNNTVFAQPGEVQTKIDNLAGQSNIGISYDQERGTVKLLPNETYGLSNEITVKPGIDLDFNGAVVTHAADVNLFFQDNGSRIYNAFIWIDPDNYSSDAVVWDTSRSTYGKYSIGVANANLNSQAEFNGYVVGDPNASLSADTQGTALHLNDAAGAGITLGSKINLTAYKLGQGLHASVASGGFVNFSNINVSITGCHTLINHTGSGPFRLYITGELQPAASTEYGVRNQTTTNSITFYGQFWDPSNAGTNALQGTGITIHTTTSGADRFAGNTSASFGQIVMGWGAGNNFKLVDDSGNYWEAAISGSELLITRPNTDARQVRFAVTGGPRIGLTDYNNNEAEIYVDGGELKAEDSAGNITTLT